MGNNSGLFVIPIILADDAHLPFFLHENNFHARFFICGDFRVKLSGNLHAHVNCVLF